jgi:hypothetical protein
LSGFLIELADTIVPFLTKAALSQRAKYVLSLFFAMLLGVGLHSFLGVPASVNDVRPRGVCVMRRVLVMSTLVMLGRLSMVASGVCQVLRGLLVMFRSFLRRRDAIIRSRADKKML